MRRFWAAGVWAATASALWAAGPAQAAGQAPDRRGENAQQAMDSQHLPNRLSREKSPYLLQHADNPVDWYPWGEEAFVKARREDKPIFLSIGYSTCHWCHVMERESFESPEIAAILNEHFVSIKVDREERPDVDHLYMQAVISLTGQGGWPLSAFLTPNLKPFYGGTYFPPEDAFGQPGFKSVLLGIAQAWRSRRDELVRSGEGLAQALASGVAPSAAGEVSPPQLFGQAFQAFAAGFDGQHGGFDPAPKFPRGHALSFLMRYSRRTGNPKALEMVDATLRGMAAGGIQDHLGGGFHRYSTDAAWFLPHFEKMLYDQAILARTCLEAYQATGKEEHARTARRIFDYVLREMRDPAGGFYSAEDADSMPLPQSVPGTAVPGTEKREGAFYVWSAAEIQELLGSEPAEIFGYLYGVQPGGNVAHDPMGEFSGQNVLFQARSVKEAARKFQKPEEEIRRLEEEARRLLFEARARRIRPHRDDKVLTDWNGLMISALAFGARTLEDPRYAQAAERAAQFILKTLVRGDGRLLHRYRDGEAGILGHLEDYAFFIHGLLDLYETTFDTRYLAEARRLSREMVRLFWDESGGGFFLSGSDAEQLIARPKELYDGAIPSGNSVAALDLIRVGRMTADAELEGRARDLARAFSAELATQPSAFPQMLIALDFAHGPSREIVIAGEPADPATQAMLRLVRRRFLPNQVVLLHPPGPEAQAIETLAPFLKGQGMIGGRAAAYVCQNYACNLPVTDPAQLERLLEIPAGE